MGITIGIVDDSAVYMDALKNTLPMYLEGSEVLTSYPDGVEKIINDVDVFLVDYDMYLPGPDVVRTIRTIRPDVKIIGWSAELDSERKKEFEEAGTDVVILKGLSNKQLVVLIKSLL